MLKSVFVVIDSFVCDGKDSLSFRQARRVIYFANTGLSSALSQREPCLRSVCNDMTSNRLLRICTREHCPTVHLSHHLVGDNDSDAELVSHALQMAKEFGETHLACTELAST